MWFNGAEVCGPDVCGPDVCGVGHACKALPKLAAVFVDSSAKADARNAFWPSDTTSLNALRIALKHHVTLSKCNAIARL